MKRQAMRIREYLCYNFETAEMRNSVCSIADFSHNFFSTWETTYLYSLKKLVIFLLYKKNILREFPVMTSIWYPLKNEI